jgi:hypothetical protein
MDVVGDPFILCVVDEAQGSFARPAEGTLGYKVFYLLRFNSKQVRLKNWDARDRLFLN